MGESTYIPLHLDISMNTFTGRGRSMDASDSLILLNALSFPLRWVVRASHLEE